MIPISVQIAEVIREIGMRKQVYPRRVESGKMTQKEADYKIAVMMAVRDTLLGGASRKIGIPE